MGETGFAVVREGHTRKGTDIQMQSGGEWGMLVGGCLIVTAAPVDVFEN